MRGLLQRIRSLGLPALILVAICLTPAFTWIATLVAGKEGKQFGEPLYGFISKAPPSSNDFIDRSFQKTKEHQFISSFVYRPLFVRLNNEIDYRILRTTQMYNRSIEIGRNNVLYEKSYIRFAKNYGPEWKSDDIQQMASDLVKLRTALRTHGISLAVVGVPSKVSLFPGNVPSWYPLFDPDRPKPYDQLKTALEAAGFPLYDGRARILADDGSKGPMFPKGGTHWTQLAAFDALQDPVSDILAEQTGQRGKMILKSSRHVPRPVGTDADILDLLNLEFPDHSYGSDVTTIGLEGQALSEPLIVFGSSFSDQIMTVLSKSKVAPRIENIRYLNTLYPCAGCKPEKLDEKWPLIVASSSAVIFEINESVAFMLPYSNGYYKRFIDGILKYFSNRSAYE